MNKDNKNETKHQPAKAAGAKEHIAVVLVRGLIDVKREIKDTIIMMNLERKNYCVVLEKNPVNLGMVNKAANYVTWGEIDNDTLKLLIEKRAEKNPRDPKKTKPFFRLQPPRKGFGRKGIKFPFVLGGALGYRGSNMNELIKRML